MRLLAAVYVASTLIACTRLVAAPAAAPAPAEPTVVPTMSGPTGPSPVAQRRMTPTDPPPVFLDPQRRARLAAAFPAIDAYLQSTVKRDRLVGLAAGVVIDGELAWFRGYGQRDPARGLPVERDTAFGIGSMTKTFTTLAVLRLRDEGRVDLDRAAAQYLPELDAIAYPTGDSPRITIRHILTHTSGLPRMGNFPEYPATPPSREEFLATLAGLGLDRPPGERRVYSNLGFQLLGSLVDAVAGDHRRYTREQILAPLGMHGTAWHPEDVPEDRLAVGHERLAGQSPRARPHWRPGAADAAGGLYSSVEDLARYAAFHLAAWPARDDPEAGPLRRSTLREAHTLTSVIGFSATSMPDAPARAHLGGTGLGFAVSANCKYDHIVGHNGKTLNYRASLHMLPNRGVAVILLSNLSSINSSVLPADGAKIRRPRAAPPRARARAAHRGRRARRAGRALGRRRPPNPVLRRLPRRPPDGRDRRAAGRVARPGRQLPRPAAGHDRGPARRHRRPHVRAWRPARRAAGRAVGGRPDHLFHRPRRDRPGARARADRRRRARAAVATALGRARVRPPVHRQLRGRRRAQGLRRRRRAVGSLSPG